MSCKIQTHSVPDIEGSRIVKTKNEPNYFLFQSKLQKPIVKTWIKKYMGLDRSEYLVNTPVVLFPELEKEFLITVDIEDGRAEYIDNPIVKTLVDNLLGLDDDDNNSQREDDDDDNTGSIKFFVHLKILDAQAQDHLKTSSLYSIRIREYLNKLEADFFEYQKNFKALP
ncbi:hypothetical protein [Zunongwangia sp.]|uniref:hypothetical protein n=1 Tax=Zunongwangia sp. TaxID=1965325 RepID=UPI003AA88C0D